MTMPKTYIIRAGNSVTFASTHAEAIQELDRRMVIDAHDADRQLTDTGRVRCQCLWTKGSIDRISDEVITRSA